MAVSRCEKELLVRFIVWLDEFGEREGSGEGCIRKAGEVEADEGGRVDVAGGVQLGNCNARIDCGVRFSSAEGRDGPAGYCIQSFEDEFGRFRLFVVPAFLRFENSRPCGSG